MLTVKDMLSLSTADNNSMPPTLPDVFVSLYDNLLYCPLTIEPVRCGNYKRSSRDEHRHQRRRAGVEMGDLGHNYFQAV
jgi:hypothetical protein